MSTPRKITVDCVAETIERFRDRRPHIHCITNAVAQHFTANCILAAGGTPSMTIAPSEIEDFVTMSDALLVNLGTMDDERIASARKAVSVAAAQNKAWALDPVFAQSSALRLKTAKVMLGQSPTLVRCNRPEAAALFDQNVDEVTLCGLAANHETIIALTGARDVVADDQNLVSQTHGHVLMDRVTAMGCALTALMAGFAAVEDDRIRAAFSAICLFGLAGERAAKSSRGPGSFAVNFLDELGMVDATVIKSELELA